MAWYPGAQKMELQPESDTQPAIVPTQFIMHSIAAPWTIRRVYEYWRDSTNLESHFAVDYTGAMGQYVGTQTRADANYQANRRSDGTGAVSMESASNLKHTDPWNDAQIDSIVALGVWLHEQHDIPLRICRTWDDPGYGYHRMFPQWSTGGTACPGDARAAQFHDVIFPRIKNGEVDMALSDSDVARIAEAVFTKIFKTDNVLSGPPDAVDADTNKFWAFQSHVQATTIAARQAATAAKAILAKLTEGA